MLLLCPGSIPERDGDKLYNTCTVFSPTGTMLGKYRKVSVDVVLFLPFGCDLCSLILTLFFCHVEIYEHVYLFFCVLFNLC